MSNKMKGVLMKAKVQQPNKQNISMNLKGYKTMNDKLMYNNDNNNYSLL